MMREVALCESGQSRDHGSMASVVAARDLAELLGEGWRRPGVGAHLLADALRGLVVDGRLPVRTRVPSERALAPALGVGRGTVTRAYDQLRRDGYLRSGRGAGSWLALPAGSAGTGLVDPGLPDEPAPHTIDLRIAALPAPEPLLGEAAARAAARLVRHAPSLGYAVAGLPELRAAVAGRFAERGLPTRPEEILITSGAQHALHLVLALLGRPGGRVLLDAPTYPRTISAVRAARMRPVGVGLGETGWDRRAWAEAIAASGAGIALTIPDFHNPTGLVASAAAREVLARACSAAGTHLVVDETASELHLDGGAPPAPLAACARRRDAASVITIGSMSKSAWGGLRLGWIRATPGLVRELAAVRAAHDMAGPVLEQLMALELLDVWEAVVASRRALLRERRDVLAHALTQGAPGWTFRRPSGGLSLWVRLPGPDAVALSHAAARERVLVTPGRAFATDRAFAHHLRLPFCLPPQELRRAVSVLARLEPQATRAGAAAPGGVTVAV
jgi:DNA-binding transcriptional MocR family regulator